MLNVALVIIQYLINKWKRIGLLARYRKIPPQYLLKRDRSIQMKEKKRKCIQDWQSKIYGNSYNPTKWIK